MTSLRSIIASLLLLIAVLAIVVPLPDEGKEYLLREEEASDATLTIFSDREPALIEPLLAQFEADTGVKTRLIPVKTDSAVGEIASSDAIPDVFLSEDSRAISTLADAELLDMLPRYLTNGLDAYFIEPDGLWAGVSARVQFIVYDPQQWTPENLPSPVTNEIGKFLSGEVDAVQVSSPVLLRTLDSTAPRPFAYLPVEISASGVGIFARSDSKPLAQQFITYLYFPAGQTYFRDAAYEYPLMPGIESDQRLMPLAEILPTIEGSNNNKGSP